MVVLLRSCSVAAVRWRSGVVAVDVFGKSRKQKVVYQKNPTRKSVGFFCRRLLISLPSVGQIKFLCNFGVRTKCGLQTLRRSRGGRRRCGFRKQENGSRFFVLKKSPRENPWGFGGTTQIRTGGKAFAELCLTSWLWCHNARLLYQIPEKKSRVLRMFC